MSLEAFIFPPSPYSQALLFFMEDAKIDYLKKVINLRISENDTNEYKKINPTLKTPAIKDGSFAIGETTAILRYLSEKNEWAYYPKELQQRAHVDFWLEFIAQNIVPFSRELIWQRHLFPAFGKQVSKDLEARADKTLSRNLAIISDQLLKSDFICGQEISLADFLLTPALNWHASAKIEISQFPSLDDWLNRMISRSSWATVEITLKEFSV